MDNAKNDEEDNKAVDSFIWAVPGINVSPGGSRTAVSPAQVTPNYGFYSRYQKPPMRMTMPFFDSWKFLLRVANRSWPWGGQSSFSMKVWIWKLTKMMMKKDVWELTNSCFPLPLPRFTVFSQSIIPARSELAISSILVLSIFIWNSRLTYRRDAHGYCGCLFFAKLSAGRIADKFTPYLQLWVWLRPFIY